MKKFSQILRKDVWDEDRMDVIGQNGNDGLHYDELDEKFKLEVKMEEVETNERINYRNPEVDHMGNVKKKKNKRVPAWQKGSRYDYDRDKKKETNESMKASEVGRLSFKFGRKSHHNPHEPGSDDHKAWATGYNKAKSAEKKRDPKYRAEGEVPFDPPYSKVKKPKHGVVKKDGTIIDKSGAKHTPMSQVHHMVQQEIKKKQAELKKKQKKEEVEYDLNEEMMFKVSVDGLPPMIMSAKSPGEIKTKLRKILKKQDSIGDISRMTKADVKKRYRDMAQDKVEESTVNEISKKTLGSYIKKASQSAAGAGTLQGTYSTTAARAKSSDEQERMRKKSRDMQKKGEKRRAGIQKAVNRLTKESGPHDADWVNKSASLERQRARAKKMGDHKKHAELDAKIKQHYKRESKEVNELSKDLLKRYDKGVEKKHRQADGSTKYDNADQALRRAVGGIRSLKRQNLKRQTKERLS